MCNPAVAIMAVGAAIQVGGIIGDKVGKDSQSKKNKQAADEGAAADLATLSSRQEQERVASLSDILSVERQIQQQKATTAVSAGEAGVSGASVTALLSLIETRGGEATGTINQNFKNTKDQIGREARGVGTVRTARINGVPMASNVGTGVRIAGVALDTAGTIYNNRPTKGGG